MYLFSNKIPLIFNVFIDVNNNNNNSNRININTIFVIKRKICDFFHVWTLNTSAPHKKRFNLIVFRSNKKSDIFILLAIQHEKCPFFYHNNRRKLITLLNCVRFVFQNLINHFSNHKKRTRETSVPIIVFGLFHLFVLWETK